MPEVIDKTTIKIEADASAVPPEMEKAKQAVGGGLTASLNKAKQAALGLVAAIGSIVATSVGLYRLGGIIREEIEYRLKSGAERAKDFVAALDLSKGEQSVASLSKEISELNSRIAGSQESGFGNLINSLTGDTLGKMQEKVSELLKTLESVQGAVNAKEMRAREKKAAEEKAEREKKIAAESEAADEAVRNAIAKTLDGEEKILHERNTNIMRLRDMQAKATTEYAKSAYDTAINFERRSADAAIAEHRRGIAEKKKESEQAAREEMERTKRQAQAQAKAFADALKSVRNDAASAFQMETAAQQGQMLNVLKSIEARIQAGFQ